MKGKSVGKVLVLGLLAVVLLFAFTACGGDSAADEQTSDEQSVQAYVTPEAEVVQQVIAEPDSKAAVSDLVGNWEDISDPTRFVKITKNGEEYAYEDNEGPLPATFADGALTLKVSDTDTCKVYIDAATGHLMSVYLDNISEYTKK